MKTVTFIAKFLVASVVASLALAAPPTDKPGKGGGGKDDGAQFEPEIAYQYNGRKSQDIRLTDRNAESFVTVHSAPDAALDGFSLSNESAKLIAFAENGDLYLTSWIENPVRIGSKTLISSRASRGEGAGRIHWIDFNPSATRIVFTESSSQPNNLFSDDGRRLWVYTVGDDAPQLLMDDFTVMDVHWSPTLSTVIYFSGGPSESQVPDHIYRYDIQTSDISSVLDYGTHYTSPFFDITAAPGGSARLAVAHKGSDQRDYMRIYDLSGGRLYSDWTARGDIVSFDCSGTQLIHKDEGATGFGLTITPVGGSPTNFLSKKGTHSVSDWMARQPC